MDDKRPIYIFGIAALLILIFFIFLQKDGRRFNWIETYKEASKEPYGTFVLYELMKDYFPDESFIHMEEKVAEALPDSMPGANYMLIGEALFLDTNSVDRMVDFVYNGGNAFISSKTIPYDLMYYIYDYECNDMYWEDYYFFEDTVASLNVLHYNLTDSLGFDYKYRVYQNIEDYRWNYIDSVFFCDESFSLVELGALNDGYFNFALMPFGGGHFYIHTTPIAFTNIQMLDDQGLAYAEKVLSHLEEGPIYWDSKSRTQEEVGRRRNQMAGHGGGGGSNLPTEGPLKYILSQPSLSWAWYILLGLGLLFLVFRARRRQRIIPVLEENKNTSLNFLSTIGRLYFLQNDHKKLSLQKMRLFRNFIRERYNFTTSPDDSQFASRLTLRSEIPEAVIAKILLMNKNIEGASFVSENTMVDFHQLMDQFYKNCK